LNKIIRKQTGFSLIEVLIGSILLAIGLLAIASLHITSIRGNFFSNNLMQATHIAQDGFEFIKNLPLDHASLTEGNHKDADVTVSGIVFNRSYSIVSNDGLKTINYAVKWNDGKDHTLTFSTIRSQ
jgi:prepilin-type N-terminal cleavage/methylation domain-containing protein